MKFMGEQEGSISGETNIQLKKPSMGTQHTAVHNEVDQGP